MDWQSAVNMLSCKNTSSNVVGFCYSVHCSSS